MMRQPSPAKGFHRSRWKSDCQCKLSLMAFASIHTPNFIFVIFNLTLTLVQAARANDLSCGTLYGGKFTQTSNVSGGAFTVEWINLGYACDNDFIQYADNTTFMVSCTEQICVFDYICSSRPSASNAELIHFMLLYLIHDACYKATVKTSESRQLREPWSVVPKALCGLSHWTSLQDIFEYAKFDVNATNPCPEGLKSINVGESLLFFNSNYWSHLCMLPDFSCTFIAQMLP